MYIPIPDLKFVELEGKILTELTLFLLPFSIGFHGMYLPLIIRNYDMPIFSYYLLEVTINIVPAE